MTESGKLCLEAARAKRILIEKDKGFIEALLVAMDGTGMSMQTVLERGEEELRLLEAEEG